MGRGYNRMNLTVAVPKTSDTWKKDTKDLPTGLKTFCVTTHNSGSSPRRHARSSAWPPLFQHNFCDLASRWWPPLHEQVYVLELVLRMQAHEYEVTSSARTALSGNTHIGAIWFVHTRRLSVLKNHQVVHMSTARARSVTAI